MKINAETFFLCLVLATHTRAFQAAPGTPVLRPRPTHPPGPRGTSADSESIQRWPSEWPGWRELRQEKETSGKCLCPCACDKLGLIEERLDRVHRALTETLQAIVVTDDVKFLEKEATNLLIYNATLAHKRTPLLLRGEVLRVIDKYNM
jgi:hypothetical protein